jgi:hypothetical protein
MALQAAEKLSFAQVLGKGTTSVVPKVVENVPRFSA